MTPDEKFKFEPYGRELAVFVITCRVVDEMSWRALSRAVAAKYPKLDIIAGTQPDGMALEDWARDYLKRNRPGKGV